MTAAQTILVVDDEVSLRKVLAAMLRRGGFDVLTATDGAEAQDLLAKTTVDLVLTDLKMPNVDGMELLAHVLEAHSGVPVIMLTAHGTVDNAVNAMKLGAFDFLTKPFDQDELLKALAAAQAAA